LGKCLVFGRGRDYGWPGKNFPRPKYPNPLEGEGDPNIRRVGASKRFLLLCKVGGYKRRILPL